MKPEIKLFLLAIAAILIPLLLLKTDLFADYSGGLKAAEWGSLALDVAVGVVIARGIYPQTRFPKWNWVQWAVLAVFSIIGLIYFRTTVREQGPKPATGILIHLPRSSC